MPTIVVPKIIESVDPARPLIFLAGPIRGGGDWQAEMARTLIDLSDDVQIACPCRWTQDHALSDYFVRPFSDAPNRQLHWERHYMGLAGLRERGQQRGCVLFYLPIEDEENPHPGPESYAMDTRREIGKFTAFKQLCDARIVVGGDPRFYGLSVIRDELDDAVGEPFPFHLTMEYLAASALRIADR